MAAIPTGSTVPRGARRGAARRWITGVVTVLVTAVVALGPATAANATSPVDLGGGYVVDDAGALTSAQKSDVDKAISSLYSSTKTQLYVVFVPTFTNPSDHTGWGKAVMSANQIDTDGILLAVATRERNYDVEQSSTSASTISSSDVQKAVNDSLVPKLKSSDWAGAATAFASGLQQTQAPANLTWLWVALLIVVVGVVVLLLVFRARRRRADSAREKAVEEDLAQLERRAGGALVTIDDELRTAEQEVGFAAAQFGPDAAKPFSDALDAAKKSVREAFQLQQQLDDEIPDTVEQRATWSKQIVAICEQAHAAIEEQTESFDKLRSLEDGVEGASAELERAVAEAPASINAADAALQTLRGRYTGRTLATVDGNVDQAREVLAYATERSRAASAALTAGDKGGAVVAVRDAQHGLAQVAQLTGAVTAAGDSFAELSTRVEAMRSDIAGDVAAGRALRDAGPDVAAAVVQADSALRLETDPKDPVSALDRLTQANQAIDTALAAARDREEHAKAAAVALDAALRDARSRISQARDFISTRRGGVGSVARTRLSEAERALDDAVSLATTDPARAVQAARAAEQYAAQAIDAANDDMGGWPGQGGGGGGAQLGGLVTGLVLGGLLGGRGGSYGFSGGGRF